MPVMLNLCMIAGALWLCAAPGHADPRAGLGDPVRRHIQLLFLLPRWRKLDLLALPRWGLAHPDVRKVMRLMVPTLFGSSIAQVNLLLDTVIASLLYRRLAELAVAGRSLPRTAAGRVRHRVGNGDPADAGAPSREHRSRGFLEGAGLGPAHGTLMIAVPAMLGLMFLSVPLVATLFQHGRFTAFDTRHGSVVGVRPELRSAGIRPGQGVVPAFYSRQDTRTPVRAGVASLVANMVFNFLFLGVLYWLVLQRMWVPAGTRDLSTAIATQASSSMTALSKLPGLHFALGMASAVASYLNLMLLWRWLRKAGVYRAAAGLGRYLLRLVVACAAMVGRAAAGPALWGRISPSGCGAADRLARWPDRRGGCGCTDGDVAMGFRLRELRGALTAAGCRTQPVMMQGLMNRLFRDVEGPPCARMAAWSVSAPSMACIWAIARWCGRASRARANWRRSRSWSASSRCRASFLRDADKPSRLSAPRAKLRGLARTRHRNALACCASMRAWRRCRRRTFVERVLVRRLGRARSMGRRGFPFRARPVQAISRCCANSANGMASWPHEMQPTTVDGGRVSSSADPRAAGEPAISMRPHGCSGGLMRSPVGSVRGQQLGRKLGYPTANLRLGGCTAARSAASSRRACVARDSKRGRAWPASARGRPWTAPSRLLEAHLFDFDGDLYGKRIEVEFVAKLRDEERFDNLDA